MPTTFNQTFSYELVTLFVILDPVSTIPIFLAATLGLARSDSLKVGAYAILISFVVLLVFIAGGQLLLNPQVLGPVARVAYATFDDPVWPGSTLTARGALIYNRSAQQRAVAVLDFVEDQFSNQGDFRVKLPPPGVTTALIRLL